MKSVDLDGNGSIDYNEFLTATINREKILSTKNLEMAFQTFDKDSSGKISTDEIMQLFNNKDIEKSVFEKIVKEADENGDGEISYEEFKNLMTKFFA
jgi:calcium-dependent protein kinase